MNNKAVDAYARGMLGAEYETKPKPEDGEGFDETTANKGYGVPTKGSYNSTEKGYKTFGTEG